jgi:hypothetical protein
MDQRAGMLGTPQWATRLLSDPALRLAARCPACGAPPSLRVTPAEVDRKRHLPPQEVVLTVQCHQCATARRVTIYPVRVRHYTEAA